MTGKLTVGADGRVTGPASITHNDPWPCPNGDSSGMSVPRGVMGVLEHTMVGDLPGTVEVFNRPSFQASAHFGVDQEGNIHQFGPVNGWKAWHCAEGNAHWFGVEFADHGNPANPLTQAQITAGAQLTELLSRAGNFPLQITNSVSTEGLGVHRMGGAAFGGHSCPQLADGSGPRAGQRAQIVALAMAIRSGQPAGLKTWNALGQLSLHDLAAVRLHQDAASVLALTSRHSAGGEFAAGLARYVDTVFAGDSSRCPAGVTWHYPGKGGLAAPWTTKGELSLSALASKLGTRPSVVLQVTADVAGSFSAAAAAYLNGVFAGSALHLPAGTVLYYGTPAN